MEKGEGLGPFQNAGKESCHQIGKMYFVGKFWLTLAKKFYVIKATCKFCFSLLSNDRPQIHNEKSKTFFIFSIVKNEDRMKIFF